MIYMPYPDYRRSAKCLSDVHLKEQRDTVRHLIQRIVVLSKDDSHWAPHVTALLHVCDATLEERRRRGVDERGVTPWMLVRSEEQPPPWIGDPAFHTVEKLKLLRLDPKHYTRMMWRVT
jgi:hypothetical protein